MLTLTPALSLEGEGEDGSPAMAPGLYLPINSVIVGVMASAKIS